nr:hypothetical protein [Spirosomataceae bacterium]
MRILILLLLPAFAFAQTSYKVKFTTEKIKTDGVLDEAIWQNATSVGDFWQWFPTDTLKAQYQTEVKIA